MIYNEKVIDYFQNPRNMGEIPDADGVGEVGSPICGDVMKIWIKVDKNGIITDAKFKTFGCASAVASSSMATEMIIGKHIKEALKITNQQVVDALGGLPEHKIHCSVLAADAIHRAINDYLGIKPEEEDKDVEYVCKCQKITKEQIEEAIAHGAYTVEMVAEATGATKGECGGVRCTPLIEDLLNQYRPKKKKGAN
jgi:FeS cluster assembly scaffold protein NifU